MPALSVSRPIYSLGSDKQPIVVLSGCLFALMVGALASTRYGVLVGAATIGIIFGVIAIATYLKDPVLALIGLWLFEVLNAPVSAAFGYFSSTGQAIRQGDEVLVLLFVCLTIWRTLQTRVHMPPVRFVLPCIGVALFGALGAISHAVPLMIAVVGALLGLKLWIMIVATLLLPWKTRDIQRVYHTFVAVGVLVAAIGLADYLSHGAVSRALHTSQATPQEGVYRSEAVHSIFPAPGEYSLFMSLLFALTFARFTRRSSRTDLALALLFGASVMLSLRLKGVLSIVAVVAIIGIAQGATSGRRAPIAIFVGLAILAVLYGVEKSVITKQFSTYASSETTARSRLYTVGNRIAEDNFPLGVGFGRFASYPSRLHYSPVYNEYGLSRVYGLSATYPNFIDDTSWPSVIGETGFGGFVFFVFGIVALLLAAIRRLRSSRPDTKWVSLAAICGMAVMIVDSLGDPSLFSWLATTTIAILFAPVLLDRLQLSALGGPAQAAEGRRGNLSRDRIVRSNLAGQP